MIEISTKLNLLNSSKNKAEYKSNNEKKKERKRKRKQKKCFIMQKQLKKCIGLKFLKRKDEKLRLIELSLKIKTKNFDLQVNTDNTVMKDHQVLINENINLWIGKVCETQ